MNVKAEDARKIAEKKNDPKAVAKQVPGLLSCCHDEIKRAANIGHFSVVSPLNDLLRMYSVSVIMAVEKDLRKEGFRIGSSGNQDHIYW
jgi:hypothetical protein